MRRITANERDRLSRALPTPLARSGEPDYLYFAGQAAPVVRGKRCIAPAKPNRHDIYRFSLARMNGPAGSTRGYRHDPLPKTPIA